MGDGGPATVAPRPFRFVFGAAVLAAIGVRGLRRRRRATAARRQMPRRRRLRQIERDADPRRSGQPSEGQQQEARGERAKRRAHRIHRVQRASVLRRTAGTVDEPSRRHREGRAHRGRGHGEQRRGSR